MKLFFLRHAQSMGNLSNDYSTSKHDYLSPFGKKQAQAIAKILTKYNFDNIFVSPAIRTMQTIRPYLKMEKSKAEIWGNLFEACWQSHSEIDFNFEKKFRKGRKIILNKEYRAYFYLSHFEEEQYEPPDDETYLEGLSRCYFVKERLLKLYNKDTTKNILLVSHGYFISRLIELMIDLNPEGRFNFDNISLSCVIYSNGKGILEFLNCTNTCI